MKIIITCILFVVASFLNQLTSYAQNTINSDYVITTPIYNEAFKSVNPSAETEIIAYLKGKSLSELLDAKIIQRGNINMRDFTLPLGVYNNDKAISFEQGMADM